MTDFIFKRIAALIVPFITIYGFYIVFNGSISEGGSFPGGIILGLAFIVFATIYGVKEGHEKLPEKALVWVESYGTLWYVMIGMIGIITGGPFLANRLTGVDLGVPGSLSSGGLIPFLSFGVGIRVASTIVTLFFEMREEGYEDTI